MPYPTQVDAEKIVGKARALIEAWGVDGLSLHKLAAELGVKAPSLYRYFGDKMTLLRAVNDDTSLRLFAALEAALQDAPVEAESRLLALALGYRAFAYANPVTYGLLFSNTIAELRPDAATQEQRALPLQALMAEVSGEAESLAALRGLYALIHGFVMLELSGQFRRGGDLEAAFVRAVQAYVAGWEKK
jgi:AcrR family transcriptional regulator